MNHIGDVGTAALAGAFGSPSCTLARLDLRCNQVKSEVNECTVRSHDDASVDMGSTSMVSATNTYPAVVAAERLYWTRVLHCFDTIRPAASGKTEDWSLDSHT